MRAQASFERAAAAIERSRSLQAYDPPELSALDALEVEEVAASARLAGITLASSEIALLAIRGIAPEGRRLDDCVLVADYAAAAKLVRRLPRPRPGTPFLRLDEVVALHAAATLRAPAARPGKWRVENLAPFPGGMVAPPPWLIPFQMTAFVDRYAAGPPNGASHVAWVCEAHERFERIHPFTDGNGRAGRLLANLLLRRLGLPVAIIDSRLSRDYLSALRAADSGDPWPLRSLFARGVLISLTKLAAAGAGAALRPLSDFVAPFERAALYKAAQRGTLRALRRAGRLCTTAEWIADYRATHARA